MNLMKSKKGFTLVELLAVIAILAILVVIALPNVINMFQGAKKGTFKTELQQILRQAESTWVLEGGGEKCYYNHIDDEIDTSSQLSLQGTELNYVVQINSDGVFTRVVVSTSEYAFSSDADVNNLDVIVPAKIVDNQIFSKNVGTENAKYLLANSDATDVTPCVE